VLEASVGNTVINSEDTVIELEQWSLISGRVINIY